MAPGPGARLVRTQPDDVARTASGIVVAGLTAAIERHGHAVLGLVGGSSVGSVHDVLADADVHWSRVHVLPMDERVVPADDPDRNWHTITRLTGPLVEADRMPPANLHPLPEGPAKEGADTLTSTASRLGGVDVALLSVGEDCHVASLFPGHRALAETAARFLTVTDSPKPPATRVTASLPLLAAASTLVVVALGESKRAALDRLMAGTDDTTCPARVVHAVPEGHVVTDLAEQPRTDTDDA